jgi:hypothetical protein
MQVLPRPRVQPSVSVHIGAPMLGPTQQHGLFPPHVTSLWHTCVVPTVSQRSEVQKLSSTQVSATIPLSSVQVPLSQSRRQTLALLLPGPQQ